MAPEQSVWKRFSPSLETIRKLSAESGKESAIRQARRLEEERKGIDPLFSNIPNGILLPWRVKKEHGPNLALSDSAPHTTDL